MISHLSPLQLIHTGMLQVLKLKILLYTIYIYIKIHKWHETVPQIGNIYKTYKNI